MTSSKFISSEPKSGHSPEEVEALREKIEATRKKLDDLNGDKLEIKLEMAIKNKFITPEQEKELVDALKDDNGIYDRYNKGEITADLLSGLEVHYEKCRAAKQKLFDLMPELAISGEEKEEAEFKGENPILKNELAGKQTLKIEKQKTIKEELVNKLDEAYKELYSFLNDKKVVSPQVYLTLRETEKKLREVVKYQGEAGNIAEEIKAKYKKDTRAENKQEPNSGNKIEKSSANSSIKTGDENTQKKIEKIVEEEKSKQPFTLDQVKQAEAAVQKIKEGEMNIAGVPEELKQVVEERLADDKKAFEAGREKGPIIRPSKYVEEEKKENAAEKELEAARQEYVAALSENNKRKEGPNRLQSIRDKFVHYFQGNKEQEYLKRREERLSGVAAEAVEAQKRLAQTQKTYKEALKNYRDQEVLEKTAELKAAGKTEGERNGEMEKYAKDILLAATLSEAAKVDSLKSDRQIEQMGGARRFINEKAEEFTGWYKALPWQGKVAVSAGLAVAGVAGGLLGSTAIITSALVGQAALRVLGGSMATAGIEQLVKHSQENQTEKKLSKEFEGKFLETLKNNNEELDNKLFELIKAKEGEKTRRFVLAGTMGALVGSGALGLAVKNTVRWISDGFLGQGVKSKIFGGAPSVEEKAAVDLSASEKPIIAKPAIESLKIGTRGPEGSIIDNFKAKPELAKAFGWDGKTDISKWAGTKAHQLWLDSVKGELSKPGMAEKLTAQGFSADAEGYAKAMHKIGKGFVELDPQGHIHLSDNTAFLKAAIIKAEDFPVEPIEAGKDVSPHDILDNLPPGDKASLNAEDLANQNIKEAVKKFVDPAILDDKTFKAAAKVPLNKILDAIPPEAYEDKYALSRYWHSLGEVGAKPLDLPGSSWAGLTYDDFSKYAEMAKFLRENPALSGAAGIKNMTVEDFLKTYGSDLSGTVKPGAVASNIVEAIKEVPQPPSVEASQAAAKVAKSAFSPEQSVFLGKTITSSLDAAELSNKISAGELTVDEFGKYYAEHNGGNNLSESLRQTLYKNFNTIRGSEGIEKMKATRAINAMLEKIKQNK